MNVTRELASIAALAITCLLPSFGQETTSEAQAAATVTGKGTPNKVPVWRSTSALGSSAIWSIGGNVGIGTGTPAAKLEVNGNAQVDGNVSLSGSMFETGVGQLLWAPNDESGNLSLGLGAMPAIVGILTSNNTAIGSMALNSNTSSCNTAVGSMAQASNTTGSFNTAIGQIALQSNTTGFLNTAVGESALQSTTGSGNTAVGASAGSSITTGNSNIAIGGNALGDGPSPFTGTYNIALGIGAGINLGSGSYNIDIGNYGNINESGVIRIGEAGVTPGQQTAAYIAGITGVNISGVPVLVSSFGQLGVASSSRRFKDDIADMADASDHLMKLRPVTFRYKKAYEDGSKPIQYGLIAEEVAEVYPELVAHSADGQIESVRYQLLDPMLLNELQKQHATIQAQKEQIRSLEDRLARIEAALGTAQLTASAK